jgi:hypothetical protein
MHRRIVGVAALSLGLFACGGSTSTPPATTATAQPTAAPTSSGGPTELNISVSTTGAVTETGAFPFGAFVNGASKPCAQFTAAASSFNTNFSGTVAGQPFVWTIAVIPYTGPGTYTSSNDLPMQVSLDAASASEPFQAPHGPTGPDQFTMTTQSNGSGSFVFANWHDNTPTGPGSRVESGTIKWTCSLT